MISAYCNNKVFSTSIFQGTTDTNLFNVWVEQCLVPNLKKGQVVVMDNYVIHKSQKTKELIEDKGCFLKFLPPYSPDLNPIEKFFANLKKFIKNIKHKFQNFDDAIDYAFCNINKS